MLLALQVSLALPQAHDEALVKSLVERFFAAYSAEDLNTLLSLWSEQSPDRQAFAEKLPDLFASIDVSFTNLRLLRLQVDGEKASLRVSVDSLVRKISPPTPTLQTITRTFVLVKEKGAWKIWRYYPAAEELAKALVSTTDEAEVEKLLNAEKELVNEELVSLLLSLAERHLEPNEAQQGLRIAQLAKTIASRIDDPAGYASACNCESDALWLMGDLERAIEVKEKSIEWLREEMECRRNTLPPEKFARLQETLFRLLHWTGMFYEAIVGSANEALRKFQTMLHYAQRCGDVYAEALVLNCIGGRQLGMGEVTQGVQTMERAIGLFERLVQRYPNHKKLASDYLIALNHLASSYNSLLIPQRAFALYQKSLRLSRKLGDKVGEMGALWGIGSAFLLHGDLAKAQTYFEQSLKLAREEGHYGWVYTNLGTLLELHRKRGDINAALKCAEEALKFCRDVKSFAWELGALENLAFLLVQKGEFERARSVIDEGLKLAERLNLHPSRLYQALGDLYRKQGQIQAAIDAYRKAITNWEQQFVTLPEPTGRLLSPGRGDWMLAYHKLAACLLRLGQTEEALQVAEKAKARTLSEIVRTGKIDLSKRMTQEERQQEERLKEQLTCLGIALRSLQSHPNPDQQRLKQLLAQIAEARQAYESFRRELYLRHPDLAALRVESPSLSLDEVAQLLPNERVAILEFLIGDDQSFVFVITRQNGKATATTYPLKVRYGELTKLVKSFRERLEKRALRLPEASTLHELLIAPIEKALKGKTILCIVPDGVLWELPFAALKDKNGKFLAEQFSIAYAPSLTTLNAIQKFARQRLEMRKGQLLALAYPSFGVTRKIELPLRGTFEELPQTEREAKAIAALFGKDAQVYLRDKATEERVKSEAPRYRIIHIATHGIFDASSPLYSGLLLAQSKGEDGILEAWEIADMDLNAELVVLSACETARGVIKEGEGLIGFAWAIFVAGCPSSLLTQWQVADESTAEFMVAFYRYWRTKGLSKAEALQQAQLSLLHGKRWAHPFFWSSFVLIGDWR